MSNINSSVLNFLDLLRGQDHSYIEGFNEFDSAKGITVEIFTKGDCGRLFFILQTVFPSAKPYGVYYENSSEITHVITKIGRKYYDINGEFNIKDVVTKVAPIDEQMISDCLLDCNYSFNRRGPIL